MVPGQSDAHQQLHRRPRGNSAPIETPEGAGIEERVWERPRLITWAESTRNQAIPWRREANLLISSLLATCRVTP
jgi:hypothetical protein